LVVINTDVATETLVKGKCEMVGCGGGSSRVEIVVENQCPAERRVIGLFVTDIVFAISGFYTAPVYKDYKKVNLGYRRVPVNGWASTLPIGESKYSECDDEEILSILFKQSNLEFRCNRGESFHGNLGL
jgi:hypothetical protein